MTTPVIAGCLEALDRCERLLDQVTASGDLAGSRAHAAVGPHMRHCLDHFLCLFRGIEAGVVDYDARDRDERVERDDTTLRGVLADTRERLLAFEPDDLESGCIVRQSAAPDGQVVITPSNLARELAFLSGHTIHHLATMLLIARGHGIDAPASLGVAFSTEAYRDSLEAEPR